MNVMKPMALALLSIALGACGTVSQNENTQKVVTDSGTTVIKPSDISEANGWKQVVAGYWTKTEQTENGPITSTFISHSSKEAVEHEIALQENAKQQQDRMLGSATASTDNQYLTFMKSLLGQGSSAISAQGTCTTNPVFSVTPYNNGSRVGVLSYVSGSCTSGGRASSIAKYNGVTSNIYDDNLTQTRTYTANSDATRYTLTPVPNSAYDCAEARMGGTASTIKRHWGKTNDCIYYN